MSTRGEYTIILKKSGNQYVSLCLELMVVSCGGTKEEAIANIRDAINSYIDSIEEEMPLERPVPLNLLHEFLSEGEEPAKVEKIPGLSFKLRECEEKIVEFEAKYGMTFEEFKESWNTKKITDKYSHRVERGYMEWEGLQMEKKRWLSTLKDFNVSKKE